MRYPFAVIAGCAAVLCLATTSVVVAQGGGRGMMERFELLDDNGDGRVTMEEATLWQDGVFNVMDSDGNEMLSRAEFMEIQLGRGSDPDQRGPRFAERQAEKEARYTAMDADGDDAVSRAQFLADGEARFQATDANGDGAMTAPEFAASHW